MMSNISGVTFNDWQWYVKFRSPWTIYSHHRSYLFCEYLTYLFGLLTLIHALRHGGRFRWLWLAIIFHGLTVESVSYFVPDIDNFWHAQSTVMLLGQRLPLHIILFYPLLIYTASVAVAHMKLSSWAEPCAVGLTVVLLDIPFDIMGIKLLWWTWHDTDPNIYDRHYWVPWTSYYFHATFASGLTFAFHGLRKLISSEKSKFKSAGYVIWTSHYFHATFASGLTFVFHGLQKLISSEESKFKSAGFVKELVCCVLTGLLGFPLGALQFLPLYHPLHDKFGIHTEVCVLIIMSVYVMILWNGDRKPVEFARNVEKVWKWSEIHTIVLLHYLFYIWLVVAEQPEKVRSKGLHQMTGPCSETVPVATLLGELSKNKYLCVEKYDEAIYDFHCVKKLPRTKSEWYTICGTPFPNHVEYICVVWAFSIFGLHWFWQLLFNSGTLPTIKQSKVKQS